jgi:PTH1 family peptidyl-tRNA hydrolase
MSDFHLVVGLGNPGPRYAGNRHNIGFQTLDEIAEAHKLRFSKTEHHAFTAHATLEGQRVILAKPQTFMNESGKSIAPLARFYKVPPQRLLVVYDDLDLPLGTLRYRDSGSSGGHRGMDSIINRLGTDEFPRLRLGIGRPPGRMDPAAYVLQDFFEEEEPVVWEALRTARKLVEAWLAGDEELQRPGMTWEVE